MKQYLLSNHLCKRKRTMSMNLQLFYIIHAWRTKIIISIYQVTTTRIFLLKQKNIPNRRHKTKLALLTYSLLKVNLISCIPIYKIFFPFLFYFSIKYFITCTKIVIKNHHWIKQWIYWISFYEVHHWSYYYGKDFLSLV